MQVWICLVQDNKNMSPVQFKLLYRSHRQRKDGMRVEYEIWQNDCMVAGVEGDTEDSMREIMHYAAQYERDGDIQIFKVTRTKVVISSNTENNCDTEKSGADASCQSRSIVG
ncbi:MAG: hypothetical protein ABIU85_11130 [Methylotenera sp.]